ncbi:nucleoside 2-deoxyribosyltransferase [Paucilactobacillus wasatchensis]|uniref:Nucleoside deoxyribosyltransferase-I n=1 Tax=Paucilactobacillus wasatchensis TaxID=1335616 RepID=A0A0D1A984_9LACO|nr:nucleoside 2-deoxyribosyltransferase [Paucilactobacillus wasatchensis]KIS04267.1 Nucleoside deoxyribosyltransferase-I [Paucilactobacillus wasatchensis]
MYKNKVYLASPFFSDQQKERIAVVMNALRQNDTIDAGEIYNPQEHQEETLPFASHEWQDSVFATDMRQVKRSDVVVGILDYKYEEQNLEPDAGTIFEIGAAWAWHIPVVMVQFKPENELNLMLARSHTAMFTGDKIQAGLEEYNFNTLPTHWTDMKVF